MPVCEPINFQFQIVILSFDAFHAKASWQFLESPEKNLQLWFSAKFILLQASWRHTNVVLEYIIRDTLTIVSSFPRILKMY